MWKGFARNRHVLIGYYEEKCQVKERFAKEMAYLGRL